MTWNEALHPRGHGEHGGEWVKKLDSKISKDLGEAKSKKPEVILNPRIDQIEVGDKIRPKGWSKSVLVTGKSGNNVHTDQGTIPIERIGKVFPSNKVEAPKKFGPGVPKTPKVVNRDDYRDPIKGNFVTNHVPSDSHVKNPNEIKAIDEYTGGGYEDINGHLRFGEPYDTTYLNDTELNNAVQGLDSVFKNLPPLEWPVEVKRGITHSSDVFGPVDGRIGKTFADKGFVSTTYHATERYGSVNVSAHDKADISIILPKGAKAFKPSEHGSFGDEEREVLLPRGSRFKVIKDFMDGNLRRLELELQI